MNNSPLVLDFTLCLFTRIQSFSSHMGFAFASVCIARVNRVCTRGFIPAVRQIERQDTVAWRPSGAPG